MITPLIALSALMQTPPAERFDLSRVFTVGQRFSYQLRSSIVIEDQEYGRPYFQPQDQEINYDFTMEVKSVDQAGFAQVEYLRPTMQIVLGESAQRGRQTMTEPVDFRLLMRLSPINEISDLEQLKPPAKKPGGDKPDRFSAMTKALRSAGVSPAMAQQLPPFLTQFGTDLQRLALMIGPLDSSLDLSPKLPVRPARLGETWRQTVSSAPQKLQGKNQQAVQRVDMTYKYEGETTENGQKFLRITATYKIDSDAAAYVNQVMGATPAETGLKSMPLKLDGKLVFLLDPKTKHTVRATSEAKGGWSVTITQLEDPIYEQKISGRASLRLANLTNRR